ncbi:substrate-binding periplasmic protein [Thalassotalea marina]|uniref:Solute-binding protein family 3/N-terminal domain-containing protein n=1 Tax=Thalassotalea marina TaxID=1673741 RepID=A0A919BGA5_9GAMM|nr:transporter substrate-binding domain-containing protein [Thalassotalea marina]GHF85676.1 hypothetical protein GCM10017161_11580 [Thalassotalea marina]
MKKVLLITLVCYSTLAVSQEVNVGFEPFPPLINEDGSGIAISLLDAISQKTDLTFNIELMTYDRAKKNLRDNELDLIGITPKGNESEDFYLYAKELSWSFSTTLDVYSTNQKLLNLNQVEEQSIGTLVGNADFIAQVTNIPREKFIEVSNLNQLGVMLIKGRLKVAVFERVSMMTTLRKLGLPFIHYKKLTSIPASLAVQNNKAGIALKKQIDDTLAQLETDIYLEHFYQYNRLADSGVVSTFSDKKTLN